MTQTLTLAAVAAVVAYLLIDSVDHALVALNTIVTVLR
jgi:hypothetical protein